MARLKLKPTKYVLLKQEVSFLGHLITLAGVKTDGTKVRQVADWPVPQSRSTLKDQLSSPLILASPDFSPSARPLIIGTDASDLAIGAVLFQQSANGEFVIAYASCRLDKREMRYCTMRREMLASVYFLKHFRPYLLGKSVKVRTDHRVLQWLRNFRKPKDRVARWLEYLQDYDFDCIYRPGSRHANADALSHFPTETVNATLFTPLVGATWAHCQLGDPHISTICRRQLIGNPKPTGRELEGRSPEERCLWSQWATLRVNDGVLHLFDRAKRTHRLIVPSGKVSKVVREMHVELGHAGQRRTGAAVRQRFWWLTLHDDVVRKCVNCNFCAQTKSPTVAHRVPLQTVATVGPNHRVEVNVMGPLPTSRRGNKYIVVIVDYFTKWCEAFPMPNQQASTITSLFVNEWVTRLGTHIGLHSDQGAAFGSRLLEEELGERLRVSYKIAAQHQPKSQHHQKSCCDRTENGPVYRVGDHVWLFRPKPPLGAGHKFHRRWLGPFVTVHVRSPIVYLIRDMTNPTAGVPMVYYNELRQAQTPEGAQMRPLPVPTGNVPIVEQTVEIPARGFAAILAVPRH
ncbi:uncharacterized protein DEA37_0007369 [Paragonimus westermani]|uniref:Integrase catalytic domain-containing protein n=1 Tax=Paragonimus westermani TaxID=34504 RepID=A0A5J4NY01_9TREM|nr:uncharacterized protein DEA37_0007369 [Paragonimus westermani]